jgi:hypothetical protein
MNYDRTLTACLSICIPLYLKKTLEPCIAIEKCVIAYTSVEKASVLMFLSGEA